MNLVKAQTWTLLCAWFVGSILLYHIFDGVGERASLAGVVFVLALAVVRVLATVSTKVSCIFNLGLLVTGYLIPFILLNYDTAAQGTVVLIMVEIYILKYETSEKPNEDIS